MDIAFSALHVSTWIAIFGIVCFLFWVSRAMYRARKAFKKCDKIGVKQVIVIRRDLKMRRGKEIAQGSHASMAFITRELVQGRTPRLTVAGWYWIDHSFRKVVCQVNSLDELLEVEAAAKKAGLIVSRITDQGRTEFNGVPTITCIAVGPDRDDVVDKITGHLKLY